MKKIIFRADGNAQTGLGHLYRLFALVEIYKDTYEFIFVTRSDSALNVIPKDISLVLIPEEVNIIEEPKWLASNYKASNHILIADGYQFTVDYQKEVMSYSFKLMYIDDLCNDNMQADCIVNHAPHVTPTYYKTNKEHLFALGVDYAILRPEFLKAAKQQQIRTALHKVFVCYGGADEKNFTQLTSSVLLNIPEINEINIVLGGAYVHDKELLEHPKIKLHQNIGEIELIGLMKKSDIAFVSSSTILYETLTINLVTFTGYFVSNQEDFYKELHKKDLFYGLGDLNIYNFERIKELYYQISKESIAKYTNNQAELIDGKSKERYINLIKKLNE